MNILLIGEAYSENLGDGIICETVANLIRKEYPDCTIVVADISGKKGYADNQNKKKLHTKLFSLNRHFHPVVEYPLYLLLNSSKNKKTIYKKYAVMTTTSPCLQVGNCCLIILSFLFQDMLKR